MKFYQLIQVCNRYDSTIKYIHIKEVSAETAKLISSCPEDLMETGEIVTIQQAMDLAFLLNLDVLGISIKNNQTLVVFL